MAKPPAKYRRKRAAAELAEWHPDRRTELTMEALVAGTTLVAKADGHLHVAEQHCLLRSSRLHQQLRFVPLYDLLGEIDACQAAFEHDPHTAREQALDKLRRLRDEPGLARTVYRACVAVALADGTLHLEEAHALNRVRAALSVAELR